MRIAFTQHKGARPIAATHTLGRDEAQTAQNCNLIKGDLRSFKSPLKDSALTLTDTVKSIFIYEENGNSNWVESANDLDFVKSPISGDTYERVYFSGETEPRFFANDNISGGGFDYTADYYKLGIPEPVAAPTVGAGTGASYRAYVHSYVNSYGDEGPPSAVGSIATFNAGDTIAISDLAAAAPADRAITKMYLYRTSTSGTGTAEFLYALEATWFSGAVAYAVGEFVIYSGALYKCTVIHPAGAWDAGHFTAGDDVADASLVSVYPKTNYDPPPDAIKGFISHPSGSTVGFSGNKLYFSEPYLPHAYPTDYIVSFNEQIVAIGVYGNTVVVATDGYPYRVYGTHPSVMTKEKINKKYPCLSKRGCISAVDGVFYPTREGIVFVTSAGVQNITLNILSQSDWDGYAPATVACYFAQNKLFCFDSVGEDGFIIDFARDFEFTTLSIFAQAGFVADTGYFYIALDDSALIDDTAPPANIPLCVSKWEGSTTDYLQFTWRSKEFLLPVDTNFSIAEIILDQDFYDAIEALFDVATLNAALFAADLEGGLGLHALGYQEVCGDTLYTLGDYSVSNTVTFRLYAGGVLKHTEILASTDNLFRLPGGYLNDKVYVEIQGYLPVKSMVIATSVDEL